MVVQKIINKYFENQVNLIIYKSYQSHQSYHRIISLESHLNNNLVYWWCWNVYGIKLFVLIIFRLKQYYSDEKSVIINKLHIFFFIIILIMWRIIIFDRIDLLISIINYNINYIVIVHRYFKNCLFKKLFW